MSDYADTRVAFEPGDPAQGVATGSDPQTHRRLEDLYEISQLFATFEDVAQAFEAVVEIAARTLAIRTAMVVDAGAGTSILWPSTAPRDQRMIGVIAHAEAASRAVVTDVPNEARAPGVWVDKAALPRPATGSDPVDLVVIPLAIHPRAPFAVLQLEPIRGFSPSDHIFVDAIASQLGIALDRDHTRTREITQREHAEEQRTNAEARGATSERDRINAERSSERFEALAGANEKSYQEAQRAVGVREQLLAIVSHDLRNPLWTILLTAEGLAEGADVPESVGRIQRAANRMLRMIQDLLDFASLDVGGLALKRQPLDPVAMIEETLGSFESAARAKGIRLDAKIAPQLPKIFGDGDRILQVLSNLVGNATAAMGDRGQITLGAEARGHEVLFTVKDTGPGIGEQDLGHLFERYWRSGEVEYKGTGLGLAIARGIVTTHGGRIWAESTLGHGATFLFTIPTADVTSLFEAPADAVDS